MIDQVIVIVHLVSGVHPVFSNEVVLNLFVEQDLSFQSGNIATVPAVRLYEPDAQYFFAFIEKMVQVEFQKGIVAEPLMRLTHRPDLAQATDSQHFDQQMAPSLFNFGLIAGVVVRLWEDFNG